VRTQGEFPVHWRVTLTAGRASGISGSVRQGRSDRRARRRRRCIDTRGCSLGLVAASIVASFSVPPLSPVHGGREPRSRNCSMARPRPRRAGRRSTLRPFARKPGEERLFHQHPVDLGISIAQPSSKTVRPKSRSAAWRSVESTTRSFAMRRVPANPPRWPAGQRRGRCRKRRSPVVW